jgi:prepilin-type N-terminal cleavage/methylation domain-containing protein
MSMAKSPNHSSGFTLVELLVTLAVLMLLAGLAMASGSAGLARLRVEAASRRVLLGLEEGRSAALRTGQPCGLQLGEKGWQAPASSSLDPCPGVNVPLVEGIEASQVQLEHNLPTTVRFTSNGLVLDGGTVVLRSEGTELERCVVVSLPLGVTRVGRMASGSCQRDLSL